MGGGRGVGGGRNGKHQGQRAENAVESPFLLSAVYKAGHEVNQELFTYKLTHRRPMYFFQ